MRNHDFGDVESTDCRTCDGRGFVTEFIAIGGAVTVKRERGCPTCYGRGVC